jgi:hypothetical protein
MWGDNMRLILTDTDSFMFAIKSHDLFEDIKQISDSYDLSGELNDKSHKKVPGYMKDEMSDRAIEDEDTVEKDKKGKGCKIDALKEQFDITNYRSAINQGTTQMASNVKNIRSFGCKSYLS